MQDNIIECQNLTHYYGRRLIYENLSFQVPRGRILGLLGRTEPVKPQRSIFSADIYSPIPENAGYSGKISGT